MIVYRFNRPNVERGDLRQFLALYGPDSLPKGAPLLELMDCFMFSVKGWDDERGQGIFSKSITPQLPPHHQRRTAS